MTKTKNLFYLNLDLSFLIIMILNVVHEKENYTLPMVSSLLCSSSSIKTIHFLLVVFQVDM